MHGTRKKLVLKMRKFVHHRYQLKEQKAGGNKDKIMDLQIESKVAFISGSTKGIGLATAEVLAQEGAYVILNGRTKDGIDTAIEKIKEKGMDTSRISGMACDFSKPEEVRNLITKLDDVDILINNVGIFEVKDFVEITDQDWELFFQVNVMSGVRLSRALLPQMLERDWGRVIFISSESGLNIPKDMIHYSVTKTAILGLARGLAKLTTGTGVTVNSILPGPTITSGFDKMMPEGGDFQAFQKKFFQEARPTSILQRFEDPPEIAHLIAYVASPLSSGTNGASLRVDGGAVDFI